MRARRLPRTTAAAVLVALAFAACGGTDDPSSQSRPSSAAATTTTTEASGVAPELAFTSAAIGGGTVEGSQFQGRPTLLWFWSPW